MIYIFCFLFCEYVTNHNYSLLWNELNGTGPMCGIYLQYYVNKMNKR